MSAPETRLPDSYALITGASRGLGKAFAHALASRNYNLILIARSEHKLRDVAGELTRNYGIVAQPIVTDLSQPAAAQQLSADLKSRNVITSLLVNNAGFGVEGEFYKLDLVRQLDMINLHNRAVVELTYLLLPPMIATRRGGIINISSMAGMQAVPYAALYSATKSFLTTFSLALERELRKHNIAVVTVCPGRLKAEVDPDHQGPPRKKFPGGEQGHDEVVAATLRLLNAGGGLLIPGAVNKIANFAERFFPRRLVTKGVGKLTRPKS